MPVECIMPLGSRLNFPSPSAISTLGRFHATKFFYWQGKTMTLEASNYVNIIELLIVRLYH